MKWCKIKSKRKGLVKRIMVIALAVIIVGAACAYIYLSRQLKKLEQMSVEDMIAYSTKGQTDARITVGIIKDGAMSWQVYGPDGKIMENEEYEYEIGSLTKTFTGALLCKAVEEGKVNLEDSIDQYISLPKKDYYPTIQRLVTHTSGYKGYYFEKQMVSNFFHRQENDFYGIDQDTLIDRIGKVEKEDKDYSFCYSNFGMAVVGAVLSNVYGEDYSSLMRNFIQDDLGLSNTRISDSTGDLSGYWNWKADDAYIPAGGIISNISDMMEYTQMQMMEERSYLSLGHEKLTDVGGSPKRYEKLGVRMDAMGVAWIMDEENHFLWHNGGTSHFNSYLAFDPENQIGVILLSNMSPVKRIPVTLIGTKLIQNLQKQ